MKVYLAMDIKQGKVVWGYRGEREKYEEISRHSEIVSSSSPESVLSELSPERVYIADLDAIQGNRTENLKCFEKVSCEALLDRGYRGKEDVFDDLKLIGRRNVRPVLGTETYDLNEVFDGVFVSLDFFDTPDSKEVFDLVSRLNSFSLEGVIVLDVRRVGTGKVNFGLVEEVISISDNPVYVGGGVNGLEDMDNLKSIGVEGVIVSTAFHRKKLPLEILRKGFY